MPDKTFHSEFLNRCSTVHLLELLSKPNSHVRLRLNVDHSISSNGHHLKQLSDWLDLSLSITLFHLLFNPFKLKPEEAVQATLSFLTDEVVDTVGVTSLPSEESSERRRKLEYLDMQEELIKIELYNSIVEKERTGGGPLEHIDLLEWTMIVLLK